MIERRGGVLVWVIVLIILAVGGFIFLLPSLGLFDDAGEAAPAPAPPRPITVEADPEPSFEPGALRKLVETNLPEGILPTVKKYIRWQAANAKRIHDMKDYSMTLEKTELVEGKVWPTEKASVKVRHEPFSVYMSYHEPKGLKGQEVIWVDGKNDGRIVGHTGGILSLVGTLRILPNSKRAMQGNRHPVTELGLLHMVEEAVRNVPVDIERGFTDFEFKTGEMIDGRSCTLFVITRRERDPGDKDPKFHSDKMWLDDETHVPIYYLKYEWPEKEGDPPVQVEEYRHLDLKFNNGFTDADFDEKNPAYHY